MKMRLNLVRALLNDPKMLFWTNQLLGLTLRAAARILNYIIRELKERGGDSSL